MAKAKRTTSGAAKQDRDGLFRRPDSKFYWMCYVDGNGDEVRCSTKETDRKQAVQVRAEWVREAALIRRGLVDPVAEKVKAEAARPISDRLEAFCRSLEADGCVSKHIDLRRRHVAAVAEHAGWIAVRDIDAEGLTDYLAELRSRPGQRAGETLSDRTVREFAVSLKHFSKWLVQAGALPADPLSASKVPSSRTRHKRRMLTHEEWGWLSDTTRKGPARRGLTGPERELLYRVALSTGLRVNELANLTRGAVRPRGGKPVLILDGRSTKNGGDAVIDIPDDLAAVLRAEAAANPDRPRLLKLPTAIDNMADMIRDDLAAARQAWLIEGRGAAAQATADFLLPVDAAGEELAFHSLRHTFGAWQVLAGVPLNVVQKRMRHSTIVLTVDTYGHLAPGQLREACDLLSQNVRKTCGKGGRKGTQDTENRPSDAVEPILPESESSLENEDFATDGEGFEPPVPSRVRQFSRLQP